MNERFVEMPVSSDDRATIRPNSTETMAVPANFWIFVSPRERRFLTFMKSSRKPTTPNPAAAKTSATPAGV